MSAPPFMQLYVADYLGDTRHLTTEQHGAYLLLLMTMWRAGGSLPNDAKTLARLAGCTQSRWAKISSAVVAFFDDDGNNLVSKRLVLELEKAQEKSIKRAEAGTRGGMAKSLKTNGVRLAIARVLPKHSSEPEPEPERIVGVVAREREEDWPEGDPAKALLSVVSSPWLDPMKTPGLVLSAGRVSAWRREGASWTEDVVPVVTASCLKRRSPVGSWQFFDAAIAQSIANNRAKLTIPEAREAGSSVNIMDRMAADRAEAKRLAWARLDAEEAKAANGKP